MPQLPPSPPRVRLGIYLVSGIGSAVVAYLVAKGVAGDAEVTLWAALVAVVNGMSAAYVPNRRGERGEVDIVTVLVAVAPYSSFVAARRPARWPVSLNVLAWNAPGQRAVPSPTGHPRSRPLERRRRAGDRVYRG